MKLFFAACLLTVAAASPLPCQSNDKNSSRVAPISINAADFKTLQAAIDALPDTGGIVKLPPGIFEIPQPIEILHSDVLLRGAGPSTHIKNTNVDGQPAIRIGSKRPHATRKDRREALWRVQLSDLRITGNERCGHGIEARFVNELFIDGVTISRHGGDGVHLHYCYEDARINDALLTYNHKSGIHAVGCHDTVIAANHFEENQDGVRFIDGFNLCMTGNNVDDHLGNGVVVENSMGNVITGNMIEQCFGIGVVLDRDTYGTTVGSNIFTNDRKGGIDLRDAHGCAITGNTLSRVPQRAVVIDDKCHAITVSGNTFCDADVGDGQFKGQEADNVASGVVLSGASGISVTGNTFSNIATKALLLTGNPSRDLVFANNLMINSDSDHKQLRESVVANNLEASSGE